MRWSFSLGASRVFTRVDGTGAVDMVAYGDDGRDGSYGDPVAPAKGSAKAVHDRVEIVRRDHRNRKGSSAERTPPTMAGERTSVCIILTLLQFSPVRRQQGENDTAALLA